MAIDANGITWVAWTEGNVGTLRVAHGVPGAWQVEVVAEGVNWTSPTRPGVAIADDSVPHVVYGANHGAPEDGVWHAARSGDEWQIEFFDAVPRTVSGVVAGAGTLHASVYDHASYSAFLVEITSDGWWIDPLGDSHKSFVPIAWDPVLRAPAIAFEEDAGISVARWVNDRWDIEPIGRGRDSSEALDFAIDGGGRSHVLFAADGSDFTTEVYYGQSSDAGWTFELVAFLDSELALTTDSDGHAHALWMGWDPDLRIDQLVYGVRDGESDGVDDDCDGFDG